MACDTFIKIALKCRRHFVTLQIGEAVPFIEEILSTISSIICDLQTQQVILRIWINYKLFVIVFSNIIFEFLFQLEKKWKLYKNTKVSFIFINSTVIIFTFLINKCLNFF